MPTTTSTAAPAGTARVSPQRTADDRQMTIVGGVTVATDWLDPEPGWTRMVCGASVPEAAYTDHQRSCETCQRELALAGEEIW